MTLSELEHMSDEAYTAELVRVREVETHLGPATRFTTTSDYVDCNCETDYIRPRSEMPPDPEEDYVICQKCGLLFEAAPDSRGDEVLAHGLPIRRETLEFH